MKRFILCLILLWVLPAAAAEPYVVSGVTVDVTADNATAARNQAIIEGQRKAFMNLATQLAPGQAIPNITDAALGDMVSDFKIEREQFGGSRYVASYSFRFRQNPVRGVFGIQPIPTPHELTARGQQQIVTTTTTTTIVTEENSAPATPDPAVQIISETAAQSPTNTLPATPVSNMTGIDMNAPIKMMLIELPPGGAGDAENKIRTANGVMTLEYTSSGKFLQMAFRGDTAAVVSALNARGVRLQIKAPTQPPLYTLLP